MEATVLARTYYDAIDDGAYDQLRDLLAPSFVQYRPDMRLDGRERFVQFMREERPDPETTHTIEHVASAEDGIVTVEGRLYAADGHLITGYVDVFSIDDDRIQELRTYTNGSIPAAE